MTDGQGANVLVKRIRAVPRPSCRGLNRIEAASYIGLSPTKFDELVADGRMPLPKRIGARKIWDVQAIDVAFVALPEDEPDGNSWDRVL